MTIQKHLWECADADCELKVKFTGSGFAHLVLDSPVDTSDHQAEPVPEGQSVWLA